MCIRDRDIILIPQSATQEIQDKKFVYVLQSDNTLKHTEDVYKRQAGAMELALSEVKLKNAKLAGMTWKLKPYNQEGEE